MPSVKRRLFNLLAAVSLVLFVATTKLWLWSYKGDASWPTKLISSSLQIQSIPGRFIIGRTIITGRFPGGIHFPFHEYGDDPDNSDTHDPDDASGSYFRYELPKM